MSKSTVRNLIISLVAFALVVGVVTVAFYSVLKNSQTLEKQIAAVAAQNKQEASLIRLQKIAKNSEVERSSLSSYFLLRESDSISFLSEIESLAPKMGVDLQTKDLKQIDQDSKGWIEVTFTVEGDRSDVQDFIDVLEIIPFVSRIMMVNLSRDDTKEWKADIVIQVQLLSYDQ